jgi:hypothetical protein
LLLANVGSDEGIDAVLMVLMQVEERPSLLLDDFLSNFILMAAFVETDLPRMSLCDALLLRLREDLVTDACRRMEGLRIVNE